jgi:predicted nucleic acid-binding protein
MKKIRIYIDTSVIGGCFDKEFQSYSLQLFECFKKDIYVPVISEIVLEELERAPEKVKEKIKLLENIEILPNDEEIKDLAQKYLDEQIVSSRYYDDALHIASATVNQVDVLVSWNFKHIVNLKRIHLFNSVNMREGYRVLEIRTPMEVINE